MVSLATVHGHLYCITDCNIFEVLMKESLLLLQLTPCEQTFHLTSAMCVPVFGCMWSSFLESRWPQPSASRHGWNQLCSSLVSLVSTSMRWWAPISRDTVLMMIFGQPETHRNCFSALRGPVAQDLHHLQHLEQSSPVLWPPTAYSTPWQEASPRPLQRASSLQSKPFTDFTCGQFSKNLS